MDTCVRRIISSKILLSYKLLNCINCDRSFKTAVIGSGPAGFYLTQYLIKNSKDAVVDIYEKYPVPFGLVRFGVAPDHPEVKNVINSFTSVAESNRVSFLGNISIGSDLKLSELRQNYDAVVLCYGSSRDRPLNIPGEWDHKNVISARSFVGWYNGVPSDKNLELNLNVDTAVIIGHGNVALDVARILLTPVDSVLKKTDITSHALKMLENTTIRNVFVVGRRGPLQAAFTIKELREMTKIEGVQTLIDSNDVSFINQESLDKLPRARKRLTQLMVDISKGLKKLPTASDDDKMCHVKFLKSPLEILSNNESNSRDHLQVVLNKNQLDDPMKENAKCTSIKDKTEVINCGLILKSIGYMTVALDPSLPMNEKKGCIENLSGRVVGSSNVGLYCSGWSATGPVGVLASTMNISFDVARNIIDDYSKGILTKNNNSKSGSEEVMKILKSRNVDFVTFNDWKNIDKMEQALGESLGKPREKLVEIDDMVKAAKNKER